MKSKTKNQTQNISTTLPSSLRWSGLQARMTFSYVWVTIAFVLLLEVLIMIIIVIVALLFFYFNSNNYIASLEQTAQQDAQRISGQLATSPKLTGIKLGGTNTPLSSDVVSGQAATIPYIARSDSSGGQSTPFELIVLPNDTIASSSYPAAYNPGASITPLVPYSIESVHTALAGNPEQGKLFATSNGYSIVVVIPLYRQHHVIGALYAEEPYSFGFSAIEALEDLGILLLVSGVITLFIAVPIGGIFGLVTTRGLVRRVRKLVTATTLFADGNYDQRVSVSRKDEIGQLEQQFNRMAEQLVESIAQRQALAEQNARLAERSRISRELHDAISQDLFSLSMLAGGLQIALPPTSVLQPQVAALGITTTNMIREMRALLLELRPLQLEDFGLVEGLKELAESYSIRLGITVNAEIATVQLNAKAEHALLRISQEALANTVRHANAAVITLSLATNEEHVTLTISDNGSGFNPDESKTQHGLGLPLMQERVQELNGTFTLQSTPYKGTCITICLPQEHRRDSSLDCR